MKHSTLLVAAVAAALAVPGTAPADENTGTSCSYTGDEEVSRTVGPVTVYAGTGDAGMDGSAEVAAGACADGLALAGVDGGVVEVGADPADGAYAIFDGDDNNADATGQTDGYAGVSNYETGDKGSCNGGGTETNSGGCFWYDGTPVQLPLPIACGNTGGALWHETVRDGCTIIDD